MGKMKIVNLVGGINIFLNSFLSYVLISTWGANLSLNGAALSTLVCEVFGLIIFTIYFLKKGLFNKESFYLLFKPIISGTIMGVIVYLIRDGNIFISVIVGIVVYFGRSLKGAEFQTMDDKPAHLFFLILYGMNVSWVTALTFVVINILILTTI